MFVLQTSQDQSCRILRAPRHGSMVFYPKKRSEHHPLQVKASPLDDKNKWVQIAEFLGYEASMTHNVRVADKPGSISCGPDKVCFFGED
ncbi:large ribosomal subunit protein uL3-like isoform X3 [Panulirus ornatus]|uniref:large ribosomal subunit protein uL3-like isoform X3 n=1 Tax=Panulirus ornatus TaxID=150431 RepID=UPI003A8691C2